MTTIPGYPIGVALSGGQTVGIGVSIPGLFALPDSLLAPLQGLTDRLNAFRDAATFYVSKSATSADTNNGTSPGEALRTLGAAVAKANAYVAANPGALCSIHLNPGVYTETNLPFRVRRNICIKGDGILRTTTIKPAAGQEMNGFLKVDSGFMAWGLTFAGHQANAANNQQAWAIAFDELANNAAFGATGLGAYIQISPYIQNCTSITAEDDSGVAPSTSVGDTGGGILVDGSACALNSPIRSMVVDSYTQVNLGGPGCLVKNDGYAQLVSFFGTFCTYHVRTESGGQVNLSGGTTDFGTYGLMADGYSPSPIYTGTARVAAYGAALSTKFATLDASTDIFTSLAHGFVAGDRVIPEGASADLPSQLTNGQTYFVVATSLTVDTFRLATTEGGTPINFSNSGTGSIKFNRFGVLEIDVINLGANRLGPISRPNPGQLFFPRLNYPTAGTSGSPGNPVTVASVTSNRFTVTLQTASFPHEYAGGGTVTVGGSTFNITSATYNHTTGVTTLTASGYAPQVGQSITLSGLSFICPTTGVYVITGSTPINASGTSVTFGASDQAGYRIQFFNNVNRGLRNPLAAGQVIDFRLRSQISAPGHTFEYVGSGMNYDALPWRGGIPIRANERVESNNGRIFSSNTNELGDFKVGDAFSVDGTTGSVTINTDQFNLSGLNFIGPFSRNGGLSTVGVQLQEVSNDTGLISSTGAADGNTAPTQFAVKTFIEALVAATVLSLETYTTNAVSTSATALTTAFTAGDAALSSAITAGDAALSSAITAGDAATLAAANTYADTQAAAATTAANTYSDNANLALLSAALTNSYPTLRPTLDLHFRQSQTIDGRFSYARASIGSFVDAAGILRTAAAGVARFTHRPSTGEPLGLLHEPSQVNRTPDNIRFTGWSGSNADIVPNRGELTPDQTFTATLLYPSTSGTNRRITRTHSGLSGAQTVSVFAKAAGINFLTLWDLSNSAARAWFNLSTGVVSDVASTYTATIEPYPNGWYLCTMAIPAVGSSIFAIGLADAAGSDTATATDGRPGVLIWGAQLEAGSLPTSFMPNGATWTSRSSSATFYNAAGLIQTAAAGVARTAAFFPDANGVLRSAGLLLEAAATNLTPESEVFTDTGGSTGSWTANTAAAPDGTTTADKWIPASGGADANSSRRGIAAVAGTRTASIFVKKAELRYVMLSWSQSTGPSYGVLFDLDTAAAFVTDNKVSDPTGTGYLIQRLPNGWYRLSITLTLLSTGGDTFFNFGATDSAAATFPFPSQISYVANGTHGVLFWGAQIEAGTYPTSYIKTDATVGGITRAADVSSAPTFTRAVDTLTLSGDAFAALFNPREGTFVVEMVTRGVGTRPALSVDDNTASNQMRLLTSALDPKFIVTTGGATQADIDSGAITAATFVKLAGAYEVNNFAAADDGAAVVTDTSGTVPVVNRLRVGADQAGNTATSTISRLTYYPERLPDNQLSTITA